jgi:hypothetical protein
MIRTSWALGRRRASPVAVVPIDKSHAIWFRVNVCAQKQKPRHIVPGLKLFAVGADLVQIT